MIRSTFAAAPAPRYANRRQSRRVRRHRLRRGPLASLVTFLVGQAILGSQGVSLGAPGALRAVIGVGDYLGLLGALAIGLGTVIRRSAGAIAVLVGLLLVIPALAPLLPAAIRDTVGKLLPYIAGQAIFNTAINDATLSPGAGLAVFALYATPRARHRDRPHPPP